jgi:cobyrinic acid a,c-diamide synthase
MARLLPLATSFAAPALRIGYRRLTTAAASVLGPRGGAFLGHEFHYARTSSQGDAAPLFVARDPDGGHEAAIGLVRGSVMGSFAHLVDRAGSGPL